MISLALMFLKNYWKQAAIILGALFLFGYVRHHYIQMGAAQCEARHIQAERQAAAITGVSGTTFTVAIKKDDGTAGTTQTIYWEAWY